MGSKFLAGISKSEEKRKNKNLLKRGEAEKLQG
jgi:hypothetical protein